MGLAHQDGNKVILSYRKQEFTRLKDRNAKRIEEHMRSGKIEVLFNSMPREFRAGSVLIDHGGRSLELAISDPVNADRMCHLQATLAVRRQDVEPRPR